jgi:hypothetical protein
MMLQIDIHRYFAMAVILNPSLVCYIVAIFSKWPPKYKNPTIGTKFGFQIDYDVGN